MSAEPVLLESTVEEPLMTLEAVVDHLQHRDRTSKYLPSRSSCEVVLLKALDDEFGGSTYRDSYENTLSFFIQTISETQTPKYCSLCLLGTFVALWFGHVAHNCEKKNPLKSVKNGLDRNIPLWRAINRFLVTDRTPKQFGAFLHHLSQCKCDTYNAPISISVLWTYHRLGKCFLDVFPYCNSVTALGTLLFESLAFYSEFITEKEVAKGKRTRWPATRADIMPDGADAFVRSISHWTRLLLEPIAMNYLGHAIGFCGESLALAVLRCDTLVDDLNASLNRLCRDVRRHKRPKDKWIIERPHPFYLLAMFFAMIVRFNTGENLISRWVDSRRRIVLLLLSEATNLYNDSRMCQKIEYKDKVGCGITVRAFQNFVLEMNPNLDIPTEGAHPALLLTPRTPSKLLQVCDSVMRLERKDWVCFGPGCTKAYHEDVAGFQVCSACQVVRYCSRDCQRADWKTGEHPHRQVCPALRYFIRKSKVRNGLPMASTSVHILADEYVANGGDEEPVILLHEWHTERRGRSHLRLLDLTTQLALCRGPVPNVGLHFAGEDSLLLGLQALDTGQ
ncbi:hypothetical protein BDZ89DRAFT_1115275 [Hymenopellis radicata]|nr:hypothetical protein BDZ89DRAFT_1115275 [Hymenopellis radicata]